MAFAGFKFKLNEKNIDDAQSALIKKKPLNLKVNITGGNYLVRYREHQGKWYLSYVRSELDMRCKWKKKLFSSNYSTSLEMAVTDHSPSDVQKFRFRESAKISDILVEQVQDFDNDDFWGEYNYIKPEESIQEAIAKLNNKLKLKD